MFLYNRNVAIIGLGGMGKEIAKTLAERGVKKFFFGDYDNARSAEAEIYTLEHGLGVTCYAKKINVADDVSCKEWVEWIKTQGMPIHALVYTAGIIGPGGKSKFIAKWTTEEIRAVYNVNIIGMMGLVNDFLNAFFIPQKYGRIVTIGSMAGMFPGEGSGVYDSTKAAVIAYMRSLAKDLVASQARGIDIRSNCIAPRMVNTGMVGHLADKSMMEKLLSRFRQSELSEPSDVADQVFDLLDGDHHGLVVDEKGHALLPILESIIKKILRI